MVFFSSAPTAVAINSANRLANIACQTAHRRLRETAEQPKETLEKTKKNNIKIKGTKKEFIVLFILLIALAFSVWLLIQCCLDLFA